MSVFESFLLGIGINATWDGIKKLFSPKNSPENDILVAIRDSMKEFYEFMDFAFDEDIVMQTFITGVHKWKDVKWRLRDMVEYTVGQTLSDDEFSTWCNMLNCRLKLFTESYDTFIDRDRIRKRIKYKAEKVEQDWGNFDNLIDKTINDLKESWKQDTIAFLEQFELDLSFIKGIETYDNISRAINEMMGGFNLNNLESSDKQRLEKLLNFPHYNLVQIVSGTSGSGKTHFVKKYSQEAANRMDMSVAVACPVQTSSLISLSQDIVSSLYRFLELYYNSLEDYCKLLDALSIRICFVIENVDILLNKSEDWEKITNIVKDFSKYDRFRFIITINEYEYYKVENDRMFLERYCIECKESSVFRYSLSIDDENKQQDIIDEILEKEYGVRTVFRAGLSTPLEAIYYGECVQGQESVSPPSSYLEYIEKITRWKQDQIGNTNLKAVLKEITAQKNSIINTSLDVATYRHAQLMSIENTSSLFDTSPSYHLRVYPFWAMKIVGYNSQGLLEYPEDMRQWLVSCYIFDKYDTCAMGDNLQQFFLNLEKKNLLEEAVFCAYKAPIGFIRGLHEYLLITTIENPRLCYAVLRFIDQCPLKILERFKLCVHISEKIEQNGLMVLYESTLRNILYKVMQAKRLRRNMFSLIPCKVEKINCLNGYAVGRRYMDLLGSQEIYETVWALVQYIREKQLEILIENGNNKSFLDYFLRECFEHYLSEHIYDHRSVLQKTYDELSDIFSLEAPIGSFVKKNLTCAAGNLFEHLYYNEEYREEYIEVTRKFSEAGEFYDRITAWFLISNSVGEHNNKLDHELYEILQELMTDRQIMNKFGDMIDEFIRNHQSIK